MGEGEEWRFDGVVNLVNRLLDKKLIFGHSTGLACNLIYLVMFEFLEHLVCKISNINNY
jgi:hypothetical protein